MISKLDLQPKGQSKDKNLGNKNTPPLKKIEQGSLVNDVQLICQQVMNDLLTIIKAGQQRSTITRLIIITARRFLASKNQFKLLILEFGYLGHRIASFSSIQDTHM